MYSACFVKCNTRDAANDKFSVSVYFGDSPRVIIGCSEIAVMTPVSKRDDSALVETHLVAVEVFIGRVVIVYDDKVDSF